MADDFPQRTELPATGTAIGTGPWVPLPTTANPVSLPPRYRLEGEIGRGGMGVVLRAVDTELGRVVAIKALLETGDAELAARFAEEARIAGRLQHPGVAPVYDVGGQNSSRPFFTMKLVAGRTLAELLGERTCLEAERLRMLQVFEQVCQALAYAHSVGIIHRDLKPGNIMVGAFGEVQVMDWGLAKILTAASDGSRQEDRVPRPQPDWTESGPAGDWRTRAGSVMGTPAYMAPEQARGELDQVGPRADVFGLGAILCEILTGKPPFGGTVLEALNQARAADLAGAFGLLDGCGADAELVALAKWCLAARCEDRPENAGILAAAVSEHLGSVAARLRQAELDRTAEQVRAEQATARATTELRLRRRTLLLAVCVLVMMILGASGLFWHRVRREHRLTQTRRVVQQNLDSANALARLAQAAEIGDLAAWSEALAEIRHAEELLDQGEDDPDLRERILVARAELERGQQEADRRAREARAERTLVAQLEKVRSERGHRLDARRTDQASRAAFLTFGLDFGKVDTREAVSALSGRSASAEIAVALDQWARLRRSVGADGKPSWETLAEVARQIDQDPWRSALRTAMALPRAEAVPILQAHARDKMAQQRQGAAGLLLLADSLQNVGEKTLAMEVLRAAWHRFPGDFWVNYDLGRSSWVGGDGGGFGQPAEALAYFTTAVAIRPASAIAHHSHGNALYAQRKYKEAETACRQAIRLDPKLVQAHGGLGLALEAQEQWKDAAACYRNCIELDPQDAYARLRLGIASYHLDQLADAETELGAAVAMDPTNPLYLDWRGHVLQTRGKHQEAQTSFRKALQARPDYFDSLRNLGLALANDGKHSEACPYLEKAVALRPDDRQLRYHAACCFAWAASRPMAEEKTAQRWRRQALAWLRVDLAWYNWQAASGKAGEARQTLRQWQMDPNLSVVRDEKRLARLSAEERAAWNAFWADVATLASREARSH